MRCFICGRTLKRAAATVTRLETDPHVTLTGYAGRTCARKAGLLQRKLRRVAERTTGK